MSKNNHPSKNGVFGQYGGSYVPPQLQKELDQLASAYQELSKDREFRKQLQQLYKQYANRPSPLYFADHLTKYVQGPQIYLKREDLNYTGAHKINNVLGQGLLAKHLGKTKLIAETGAGQNGVAAATIAAFFGLECDIYMGGARDVIAQKPNVYRMKVLGANVITVNDGQGTLKDAVDAALNAYLKDSHSTYYLLGSAVGPHPYPTIVRDFQKVIGQEIKTQVKNQLNTLPNAIVACIGGGSNAIGAFYAFLNNPQVELIGVEPAGKGQGTNRHGLALQTGHPYTLHGFKSLALCQAPLFVDSESR